MSEKDWRCIVVGAKLKENNMGIFKTLSKAVTVPLKVVDVPTKVFDKLTDPSPSKSKKEKTMVDELVKAINEIAEDMDDED